MKYLKSFIAYIISSIAFFAITVVLSLSLLQKKFPPSFDSLTKQLKLVQNLYSLNQNLTNNLSQDEKPMDLEKIMSNLANSPGALALNLNQLAHTNKLELSEMKNKINTSEYKIKLLEYEIQQLKNEIRYLKEKK